VIAAIDEGVGASGRARRLLVGEGLTARLIGVVEHQLRGLEWWTSGGYRPLRAVLSSPDAPGEGAGPLDGRHVVSAAVTDCLALEREALCRLTSIQRDIGDLLDRPKAPRELSDADATGILGDNPGRWLGGYLETPNARDEGGGA
jgi:hypothetical protein